jgi:methylenetetrahydrofolate dehydrogenase (NADP+)/methenyltetrahydrofolate cyclohydrolase
MTITTQIIDGKSLAATTLSGLAADILALTKAGRKPGLAVVRVGDDPASAIYVRNKIAGCHKHGIHSLEHHLPASASQDDVAQKIRALNAQNDIHGILLQLPLPAGLNAQDLIETIDPAKDVDGLHPMNMGRLVAGRPGHIPCTPQGALALIHTVEKNLSGLHAVIIGRSLLFGKPMGQLLLQQDCTVTQAHSKTRNLESLCAHADILVAAVGQPKLVQAGWIKPGAIVIDVGITRNDDGTLSGDVDTKMALGIARAITPVPGGVGPMTIACLLANTVRAAKGL